MLNLKNRVVLITGGSRGIGAACVKMFSELGSIVHFTYNKDEEAAEKIKKSCSYSAQIFHHRVSMEDEVVIKKLTEEIYSKHNKIDVLVNNAGIWEKNTIESMTLEDWNRTININLTSTFLFTKYCVRFMKGNKFGRIINISSTAGQRGESNYSQYAASKGGIISFTKSLASEMAGFNITVNSVAPGWVLTDMINSVMHDENYKRKEAEAIPLKRIAEADDIAGPIVFLASDLAKHINGEILNVNGGSVLCG